MEQIFNLPEKVVLRKNCYQLLQRNDVKWKAGGGVVVGDGSKGRHRGQGGGVIHSSMFYHHHHHHGPGKWGVVLGGGGGKGVKHEKQYIPSVKHGE